MSMRRQRNTRVFSNERGMVSIIVTTILMLVISITVLGFAQVIRREQRQALDRQLSSQAFYAAESGINLARKAISNMDPTDITPKTECGPQPPYNQLTGDIDPAGNTRYTCLLINGAPKALKYDLATDQPSKVFPVYTDPQVVDSMLVQWTPPKNPAYLPSNCPTSVSTTLPAAAKWTCGYGILRIDIVPTNSLNRQDLMSRTFTAFLTPTWTNSSSPSTVSYSGNNAANIYGWPVNQGSRPAASCDGDSCKILITNMSGATSSRYYVRVSTMYEDTTMSLSARGAGGVELPITGAQVMIDSTGKANDVLRRLQVRLPLVHDGLHSDYGVETTDSICKRFQTAWNNQNGSNVMPADGTCL